MLTEGEFDALAIMHRLRPWSEDANAMLSAGLDLAAWLASATHA